MTHNDTTMTPQWHHNDTILTQSEHHNDTIVTQQLQDSDTIMTQYSIASKFKQVLHSTFYLQIRFRAEVYPGSDQDWEVLVDPVIVERCWEPCSAFWVLLCTDKWMK